MKTCSHLGSKRYLKFPKELGHSRILTCSHPFIVQLSYPVANQAAHLSTQVSPRELAVYYAFVPGQ